MIHFVQKQAEIKAPPRFHFTLTEEHTLCKESKRADQSDSNYKHTFLLLRSNVLNGKQPTVKYHRCSSTHINK